MKIDFVIDLDHLNQYIDIKIQQRVKPKSDFRQQIFKC